MNLDEFNSWAKKNYIDPNPKYKEDFLFGYENAKEVFLMSSSSIFRTSGEYIIVDRFPSAAGKWIRPHYHDFFELIFVSKGKAFQTVNGTSCCLKTGELCLLSPDSVHEIKTEKPDDILFHILILPSLFKNSFPVMIAGNNFISEFFYNSLFRKQNDRPYIFIPENDIIISHTCNLIKEYSEKQLGYEKAMECNLALVFTEVMRNSKKELDTDSSCSLPGSSRISDILGYIYDHKNTVTLKSAAEEFHYNPSYLSSLIKKYTGRSFSGLLNETRLSDVCFYLKNTDMPIDEIAQICCYYDRSHFNRVFRKRFGMTPSQWRRKEL